MVVESRSARKFRELPSSPISLFWLVLARTEKLPAAMARETSFIWLMGLTRKRVAPMEGRSMRISTANMEIKRARVNPEREVLTSVRGLAMKTEPMAPLSETMKPVSEGMMGTPTTM